MPGPAGSPFTPPGGGAEISIALHGLDKLIGRFKVAKAGLYAQGQRLEGVVADEIAERARDFVPVETGATQDSIRVEKRPSWGTVVVADRDGDRPEVPIYLEIGTYKMAARPFMKPAADLVMSSRGLVRGVREIGGLLPPTARR